MPKADAEKRLTKKLRDALLVLGKRDSATVYDVAGALFNERYGITASRAGGRLQSLKRMGYATNANGRWMSTDAGRAALRKR